MTSSSLLNALKKNVMNTITSALLICLIGIYSHFWREQVKLTERVCRLEDASTTMNVDISLIKLLVEERNKNMDQSLKQLDTKLSKLEDLILSLMKK